MSGERGPENVKQYVFDLGCYQVVMLTFFGQIFCVMESHQSLPKSPSCRHQNSSRGDVWQKQW